MKAKEYFEKYEQAIIDDCKGGGTKGLTSLVVAMSKEVNDICKQRHSNSNRTVVGAIKEQNTKWNAICSMLEKKYGASPLKWDGFLAYWKREMPHIEQFL